MDLNTNASRALGHKIHGLFGSWQAVREAATKKAGVYVLTAEAIRAARAGRNAQRTGDVIG